MKNKSLSIRLAAVFSGAMLCAGLVAGCGNGKAVTEGDVVTENDTANGGVESDTVNDGGETDTANGGEENGTTDFNHGHSISETSFDRPEEIKRSYEVVLRDSDEALEYLERCVPSRGSEFTYELTDTSDDDPGAYMWYQFNLCYDGDIIDGADFKVIAFTDGTIVEGWSAALNNTVADKSKALDADDVLQRYINVSGDARQYVYCGSGYKSYGRNDTVFRYVHIYRYDCGDVLNNITLELDAETGEKVGCRPDAIN